MQWSSDGAEVFFTYRGEVYAGAADGSRLRRVARPHLGELAGHTTAFHVASDGVRLVYASCEYPRIGGGPRAPAWEYQHDLVLLSLDSGARRRLTASNEFEGYPAWSPDGAHIAYLSGIGGDPGWGRNDLYVMEVDGANARVLRGPDNVLNQRPAWSPDGHWLAVTGMEESGRTGIVGDTAPMRSLYIIPMSTGREVRRLTDAVSGAAWSPDGQRLAFAKVDGAGVALYSIAADGTDAKRLTTIPRATWDIDYVEGDPARAWVETVAWSPDGSKLLYTCAAPVSGICVVAVDGTPVSQAPLDGLVAAWSPDGSQIVTSRPEYVDRERTAVVQIVAPDGANAQTLVMQDAERQLRALGLPQRAKPVGDAGCATGTAVAEPAANPGLVGDCEVLLALRDTLAGAASLNWTAGRPLAEWDGVVVAGTPPRVRELRLIGRGLSGRLPRELGQLTQLAELDLRENALGVNIPPELGDATALRELILTSNSLSGSIPAELGQLTGLGALRLGDNRLTGWIPAALARLPTLVAVDLSHNRLTGPIPVELGQTGMLVQVDLSANRLTGPIPTALLQSVDLRLLRLSYNQLTGPIPAELGQSGMLVQVDLSANRLTGPIPTALLQSVDLRLLGLSHNRLTGPIPAELGQLVNLVNVSLSHNHLTGPIPVELGQLVNLEILGLSSNQLTGPIPAGLGQLANLRDLYLDKNQLTGPIPAELGQLVNLKVLGLSSNQLTGPIPAELGQLNRLRELYLGNNQLTGCLPRAVQNVRVNYFDSPGLPMCE